MNSSPSHSDMNPTPDAMQTLRSVFGYDGYRSGQQEVIEHVLAGGSGLVVMPTGAGKSMCYQLPALVRTGTTIVISPLIALMQDQVASLVANDVSAAFLNSTLTLGQARDIEQQYVRGELDLLYLAPERLMTPYTQDLLRQGTVGLIAIDEAHCVSQWGHDFRPEYLRLSELVHTFPDVPRLALTATADPRTQRDIQERLSLEGARGKLFVSGFDRPNLTYRITERKGLKQQLLAFVRRYRGQSGIVYAATRKRVEETAAMLAGVGIRALPYHAGLDDAMRQDHQRRFQSEEGVVIVATIAFGMGVDKPDVRFVAHINLPKSIEAYYQETGRAGRDGDPAEVWMAYGTQDIVLQRGWIEGSDAPPEQKRIERERLNALVGFCESAHCRRISLLRYFGDLHEGGCGNCDNCLSPPETYDATTAAQKALSCVFRCNQQFGISHLVDVLRGNRTEKVERFSHHQVSTFGIGKEDSAAQWKQLFRQLIAAGYCDVDPERYGALVLQPRSRDLLTGGKQFLARKARKTQAAVNASKSGTKPGSSETELDTEGETLYDELRRWRGAEAARQSVPPYVVFANRTLRAIAAARPLTDMDLLEVSGVGDAKLKRYGQSILELVSPE